MLINEDHVGAIFRVVRASGRPMGVASDRAWASSVVDTRCCESLGEGFDRVWGLNLVARAIERYIRAVFGETDRESSLVIAAVEAVEPLDRRRTGRGPACTSLRSCSMAATELH